MLFTGTHLDTSSWPRHQVLKIQGEVSAQVQSLKYRASDSCLVSPIQGPAIAFYCLPIVCFFDAFIACNKSEKTFRCSAELTSPCIRSDIESLHSERRKASEQSLILETTDSVRLQLSQDAYYILPCSITRHTPRWSWLLRDSPLHDSNRQRLQQPKSRAYPPRYFISMSILKTSTY